VLLETSFAQRTSTAAGMRLALVFGTGPNVAPALGAFLHAEVTLYVPVMAANLALDLRVGLATLFALHLA
jgi:hypothetical protein